MNRFQRLVDLRRIREETAAMALGRIQGAIQKLQGEILELDRETAVEKGLAKENLVLGRAIPANVYEDFFRGQVWRRRRMEERKSRMQVEAETARQAWYAARTLLQQAEKLAQKDDRLKKVEERRKEGKELDMVGILGTAHLGS